MIDLSQTVIAKSDQLNADDMISGPMTIQITAVNVVGGDQPVVIGYEGDNGKPYKPCKSMRRALIHIWGKDGSNYVGKSMTIYADPKVKWAGAEIGGIRISHATGIEKTLKFPLTVSRGKKVLYAVLPLLAKIANGVKLSSENFLEWKAKLTTAKNIAELGGIPIIIKKMGYDEHGETRLRACYSAAVEKLRGEK